MRFIKRLVEVWYLSDFLTKVGATPTEVKDAVYYFRLFKASKVYSEEAAAFQILLRTVKRAT